MDGKREVELYSGAILDWTGTLDEFESVEGNELTDEDRAILERDGEVMLGGGASVLFKLAWKEKETGSRQGR